MTKILCLFLIITSNIFAIPLITLSGSATSGAWGKNQNGAYVDSEKRIQFESAANLNVNAEFSDSLSASTKINLGKSNSVLGFSDGVVLKGVEIKYSRNDFMTYTVGLTSIPFGQSVDTLTSNAEFNSPFIINDLFYTYLSGSKVHGLVSNGVKVKSTRLKGIATIESAMFNGMTNEDANSDGGFGIVLKVTNDQLIDNITFGTSYLAVNDTGNDNSAISASLRAAIADVTAELMGVEFGGYYAISNANDFDASTNDNITSYMVYLSKELMGINFGFRFSGLCPDDYNADGTYSASFINTGLAEDSNTQSLTYDQDINRFEISAIVPLEEGFSVHNQVTYDKYGDSDYDTLGILSYASVNF